MEFQKEEFDEIMNIFRAESEEIFRRMNTNLLLLEKTPDDKEIINYLFRDAHSLKGASRMVGFNRLQKLAHRLEDLIDYANTGKILVTSDIITLLYKVLDYIAQRIIVSVETGHESVTSEFDELLKLLQDFLHNPENTEIILPKTIDINEKRCEEYKKNYKEINICLNKIICSLKANIKEQRSEATSLFVLFSELDKYFSKKYFGNVKTLITEVLDKLNFVQKATGFLIKDELDDIYKTTSTIQSMLKMILPQMPIIETDTEGLRDLDPIVRLNGKNLNDDINKILILIQELEYTFASTKILRTKLLELIEIFSDNPVIEVYKQIIKLVAEFEENNSPVNADVLLLFKECVRDSKKFLKKSNVTPADTEYLIQRLNIASQVVNFDVTTDYLEDKKSLNKRYEGSNEFLRNFENISIKTLRVDTQKLDKLVNKMSELIVSRIKINDHLKELKSIKFDIQDICDICQKYDKLANSADEKKNSKSFFTENKFHQNLSEQISEKIFNIENRINELYAHFYDDHEYYNQTIDSMEQTIKNVRVLPIATIFHLFPRMVRDISKEENKDVEILISGGDTSVDKKIIEEIKTPLIHIIRNSIDHGIEPPEERKQLGKSPTGKIQISAKNYSNKIIIEIKDDGRGVNLEKIKMKALAKGLLSENELKILSNEQIMNLIFLPGFSTGEEITDISGRGVGLDVVQTKITQLDGKVKVNSVLGQGSCVTIELPVSMVTIKSFIVETDKQFYAIPIVAVSAVLNVHADKIFLKDGEKTFIYNENPIKILHLNEILGISKNQNFTPEKFLILILESDNHTIGVIIDKIEGDQEILQKKFAPPIFRIKNILGLTTLTSGRICFILNVSDIFKTILQDSKHLPKKTPDEMRKILTNKPNKDYNILVYEIDNLRNNLTKLLQHGHYTYTKASNEENFFNTLKTTPFDLIILSLPTNANDTINITKQLKTNELYEDIPLFVVGENINDELQEYFSLYKVNDILSSEQLDSETFFYKIKKILGQN